jgi:fatty-acyl-CoA synthase
MRALEFAPGLASATIVTGNPAFRAGEFVHVLGQSRADGIFLLPEYRGIRGRDARRA